MGSGISVCQHGQIGVATDFAPYSTASYIGVLLSNNAGQIATSSAVAYDVDGNKAQQAPCVGTWDRGAGVTCDSSGNVISAIDTVGQKWNCKKNTSPISGAGELNMYACCDRA